MRGDRPCVGDSVKKGSLQRRMHGRHWVWVALWWVNGLKMSRSEAMVELEAVLQPLNTAAKLVEQSELTFREFIEDVYLRRRGSW